MFILISPVRNEERFLPGLMESVLSQTVLPILYVIVDHASTDSSTEIIRRYSERYEWIHYFRLEREGGGSSAAIKSGFEYARKLEKKMGISSEYYAILDTEIRPPQDYFERIMEAFQSNPELGIASGSIVHSGKKLYQDPEHPWGACFVISHTCLEAIGGFPEGPVFDSTAIVMAQKRGFMTRNFPEIEVRMEREMGAREGLSKGYFERGRASGFLGERLFMALAKAAYYTSPPVPLKGLSFMRGYLRMRFIEREKAPREVREYYRNKSVIALMKRRL